MDTLKGKIISTWSEPANGAPVVVEVASEDGVDSVVFQRELWNTFFFDHQGRINDADFRVEVWGEPWQQQVVCCDPTCLKCEALRETWPADEEE